MEERYIRIEQKEIIKENLKASRRTIHLITRIISSRRNDTLKKKKSSKTLPPFKEGFYT